jgi:hypothetical protein
LIGFSGFNFLAGWRLGRNVSPVYGGKEAETQNSQIQAARNPVIGCRAPR